MDDILILSHMRDVSRTAELFRLLRVLFDLFGI